jgi:HD-GYP domain-containing protein (c-di-GMP phosphodiesterase class II)
MLDLASAAPPQVAEDDASRRSIMARAAETAQAMLGMDMSFISDTRAGVQDFVCLAGDASSFSIEPGGSTPLEGTYCQLLLQGRLDPVVRDASREPLVAQLPATGAARIGAYIGVPVVLSDGETYGTFCCVHHEPRPDLRERDVQFLQVLAQLVADQLEEERRLRERHRLEVAAGSVGALLVALAARDGYTEEHSLAVVELALAVGKRLGMDAVALADLENAALLHDIGKLGVPDAILTKPGRLTPDEYAEMRRHPEIGESIVASMPTLAHLAPTIRAEHERWDGAGYPDGLAGERIPLAARIVFVCDAFHAMTSDRPYRAAMTAEEALAEIDWNIGTQFCPHGGTALVTMLREAREPPR